MDNLTTENFVIQCSFMGDIFNPFIIHHQFRVMVNCECSIS